MDFKSIIFKRKAFLSSKAKDIQQIEKQFRIKDKKFSITY
jgi:hypothetical protein